MSNLIWFEMLFPDGNPDFDWHRSLRAFSLEDAKRLASSLGAIRVRFDDPYEDPRARKGYKV